MNVTRSDVLQADPLADVIAATDQLVQTHLDLPASEVRWELRVDSRGRRLLALHISEQVQQGEARAEFSPEELQHEEHLASRLRELKAAAVRVGAWKRHIRDLFTRIAEWAPEWDPPAIVEEQEFVVNEQRSGPYRCGRLVVRQSGAAAFVEPVAAWVVGADGRADLKGPMDAFPLLLVGGDWFVVEDTLVGGLRPLSEEVFAELLAACLR